MEKGKKILLKFLIVLVTVLCAGNGRTFVYAGNSIQILLNHNNDKNAGESHQNHFSNLNDEEKWIQTEKYKILSCDITLHRSFYDTENPSGEFSDSVWQPPKPIFS
jgi:hypothetical protein